MFPRILKKSIFRRILQDIFLLQGSHKMLQDSARIMHNLTGICKDVVRFGRLLQEMHFSSTHVSTKIEKRSSTHHESRDG